MTAEKQQITNQPEDGKPKRRISGLRILLVIVLLVVLSIGGAIAVLLTLSDETLKPIVEKVVTAALDRAFVLEGNFEVKPGREFTIRADGVKIANATWSSKPYMLDVEQAYVVLDVWALTRGQILLRDARAKSAMLLFEEDPAGTLNWDFEDEDSDDDADDEPLTSIPLLLEKADLNNVRIELDLPVFKEPLRIRIDSAKQVNGEEDILDLVIAGSVNDRPLNISGHVGPFTTLLVGLDIDYDIDAKSEFFTLTSKGHIDDLAAPKKPSFELELKGADVTKLTELLGIREITSGPLDLKAGMQPVGDAFKATIDGDVGEFLIDLSADLKALDTVKGLKLNVKASGPDLSVVGAIAGVKGVPPDTFELTGQVEESGGALSISNVSLIFGENAATLDGLLPAFPKLKGGRLSAGIKGPDLLRFRELLQLPAASAALAAPFDLSGELKDSGQGTDAIDASLTVGEISARVNGTLTDADDYVGTRAEFEARGPDIDALAKAFGLTGFPGAPFDAKGTVEVTARGFQFDRADFRMGGITASVRGLVGREPLLKDSDLDIDVAGNLPEAARIADVADLVPQGDFELSFGAKATANGIELNNLNATIDGETKLNASGLLGKLPSIDDMDLNVSASSPEPASLVPEKFKGYAMPPGALRLSGRVRKRPAGFRLDKVLASIGDNKLDLSGTVPAQGSLAGTDVEISASGPNLAALLPAELVAELDIPASPFEVSAAVGVSAAMLSVQKLVFEGARGRVSGDIELALDDITSGGRFSLEAKGNDLDEMIPNRPRFEPAKVPFDMRAKGEWNKESVAIEYLNMKIADATFDLQGKLDLPPDMRASNIVLSAKGSSLASLGSLDGRPLPDKPFDLDGTLDGDIDTVQIQRLTAHVGDSDLTGQFKLDIKDKPTATVKFVSQKMDLAQFLPEPVGDSKTTEPATSDRQSDIDPEEKPADQAEEKTDSYVRLIPDLPIPFETLNSFNLVLNADAGVVIHPLLTLSKFDLDAKLEDGNLSVERWSADAEEGNFVAKLDLTTDADIAKLSISLEGSDLVLAMGNVSAEEAEKYPASSMALKMTASGASLRELAASLNGYGDMLTKPGQIPNNIALALFGDFFQELLSKLNPFVKKENYTKLDCGAYFVNVGNGVVTIDPGAVLQTDKINVFASGSVDLKTEKLDINFNTTARKGIGISAGDVLNPFVRIGGTLADPKLRLDVKSSAIEGGAAVATFGATIVAKGLWGRWIATKDPCGKFVEEAKKQGRVIHVAQ